MATGGVTGSALIDQELLCQICLNPLVSRKARMLSCLHTFCESCLEHTLVRTPGTKINCSTCRQATELPEGLVTNLPLNFHIGHTYQIAEEMAKTPFCTKCIKKKEFVPANLKCITCNWQMCNLCKNQHDLFPGFSSHRVEPVNTGKVESHGQICKLHETPVTLFCSTCNQLLCTYCLMEGIHDSHPNNIKRIDVVCKENRKLVFDKKTILMEALDIIGANHQKTIRIQEHFQRVKKDIIEFADSLKSQIDENVEDLIRTLEQNHIAKSESRKASLSEGLTKMSFYLRNIGEFETQENSVFLQKSESWIQDVTKFERIIQDLKKDEAELVKFSKRLQMSAIGSFDKIDQFPPASKDTESMKVQDTERSSRDLKEHNSATTKPTLLKRHVNLSIDHNVTTTTINDESVVFVSTSETATEWMRINITGKMSWQSLDCARSINSASIFGGKILFTDNESDNIYEMLLNNKKIIPISWHKKHGMKARGLFQDLDRFILLWDEKSVAKVGNTVLKWKKNVGKTCTKVTAMRCRGKQLYTLYFEGQEKYEYWDEDGEKIG